MYHAYAFLEADTDLTFTDLMARLKERFPEFTIERTNMEVTLTQGDWVYRIVRDYGPEVIEEAEGIAGRIAGLGEDNALRNCDRRVDISSDTPDPFMEHFDKHFQVLEVLRTFKGVILVDPAKPELL